MSKSEVFIAVLAAVSLIIIAVIPKNVQADTYLLLHIGSKHSAPTYEDAEGIEQEFNENNFGLGVAYDLNRNFQLRAGFYDNSYNKLSILVGGSLHSDIRNMFVAGVQLNFITGYEGTGKHERKDSVAVTPLPFIQLSTDYVGVELGYVPVMSVFTMSVVIPLNF